MALLGEWKLKRVYAIIIAMMWDELCLQKKEVGKCYPDFHKSSSSIL
jgi:hypothetical protein